MKISKIAFQFTAHIAASSTSKVWEYAKRI